jgi:ABC-type antimicrobial peptide transport system permease subunit
MVLKRFKQTLAGFRATKLYSTTNVIGLALGFLCSLMIAKYIYFECSADRFNKNFDRLYFSTLYPSAQSNPKLYGPNMLAHFSYSQFSQVNTATTIRYGSEKISFGVKTFSPKILVADTNFVKVFDFPMKIGQMEKILKNPDEVILSEKMAGKIFGDKNPLDQQIEYRRKPFKIAGVAKNVSNSSFDFDLIIPKDGYFYWNMAPEDFILLNKKADLSTLNNKITEAIRNHPQFPEGTVKYEPFKNLYFSGEYEDGRNFFRFGNKHNLYILGIIAFLVFGISIFNFTNIYNVVLMKRSKGIGVKKVLGAGRFSLVAEFVREVFVLTLASAGLSALLSLILMPAFQKLVGKEVLLPFGVELKLYIVAVVAVTLLASIFPSMKYSVIKPLESIKEALSGKKSTFVRKFLMSTQYIVTISLLIISLFFIKQLDFMLSKEIGFKKDNIIKVHYFDPIEAGLVPGMTKAEADKRSAEAKEKQSQQKKIRQYIINDIKNNPYLHNLCFGNDPMNVSEISWKVKGSNKEYQTVNGITVTPDFLNLYGLSVKEGRFFKDDQDNLEQKKIIINESAQKFFGIKSLDDANLSCLYWGGDGSPFKVIGVIKDYSYQHLSASVNPLVLYYSDYIEDDYFMMQITKGKEAESIAFLKNLFEKVNPGKDFQYEFVEDRVKLLYQEDKKVAKIYTLFAVIAMFIASLGLFSFSIFDIQQRFKEIGIRKINGAKEVQVIQLLTRKFVHLVSVSFVFACPVAWFTIQKYLENFANKTEISWWLYAAAAGFTFFIAYLTLIWQSWRAATQNPVEALRYE